MLLRMNRWQQIREYFSEEEKKRLNECITGECICPHGVLIEYAALGKELAEKLERLLRNTSEATHGR